MQVILFLFSFYRTPKFILSKKTNCKCFYVYLTCMDIINNFIIIYNHLITNWRKKLWLYFHIPVVSSKKNLNYEILAKSWKEPKLLFFFLIIVYEVKITENILVAKFGNFFYWIIKFVTFIQFSRPTSNSYVKVSKFWQIWWLFWEIKNIFYET